MTERGGPSVQEISDRAYELYLRRGGEPGKDVEDWLKAEKGLSSEVATAALVGRNQSKLTQRA